MSTRRVPASLAALLVFGASVVLSLAAGCSEPVPLAAGPADSASGVDAGDGAEGGATASQTGPPTIWLDDVEYYDYLGGVTLPGSPTAGPAVRDNGLASGFTQSPMGAVMAGANILARIQGAIGAPVWVPTIQNQVVGPHQVYLLRLAQAASRPGTPAPGETIVGSSLRFVGWQWESYSNAHAVVRQLIAVTPAEPDGKPYLAIEVETRWSDGDWRMVAPEYANWVGKAEELADTSGFEVYNAA